MSAGRAGWRMWAPLLVAPALALAAQTAALAVTPLLCARQADGWIHAVFAVGLAGALALLAAAWGERRRLRRAHAASQPRAGARPELPTDTDRRGPNRLFLADAATGMSAIASLAMLAMWIPTTLLSPCWA